ncbi:hypothetical protein FACS189421_06920 [Bacteroidia bacterium]|nr:hypothetical protein FACS189421_06920 [Bacteroidia bacterium]
MGMASGDISSELKRFRENNNICNGVSGETLDRIEANILRAQDAFGTSVSQTYQEPENECLKNFDWTQISSWNSKKQRLDEKWGQGEVCGKLRDAINSYCRIGEALKKEDMNCVMSCTNGDDDVYCIIKDKYKMHIVIDSACGSWSSANGGLDSIKDCQGRHHVHKIPSDIPPRFQGKEFVEDVVFKMKVGELIQEQSDWEWTPWKNLP